MKALLVVAAVALIHGTFATLVIKGPTEPLLDEKPITLECLITNSNLSVTQVHFEYKHPNEHYNYWRRVWGSTLRHSYCFSEDNPKNMENTGLLYISNPLMYSGVAFRCVPDKENVTAPDNASEPLTFKVQYLREPLLYMKGYSRYLGAPEVVKVRPGDDVVVKCSASSSEEPSYRWQKEGDDWILPSSTLTLKKVSAENEGQYTCTVEHPSVESLSKKRTIRVTLLPEDAAWYETTNGHLWLTTSAAAVSLLVFIVSLTVFLCRRAKRIRTSKGPIDDHSQKKPIYKTSVDSLPSTCADNQPLV